MPVKTSKHKLQQQSSIASHDSSQMSLITTTSTSGPGPSVCSPRMPKIIRQLKSLSSHSSQSGSHMDVRDGGMHRRGVRRSARILRRPESSITTSSTPELPIQPMQFEIHWLDSEMPFVGRNWVFHELHEILLRSHDDSIRGAVIHGNVGTGKSAILYQLAAHSNSRHPLNLSCIYENVTEHTVSTDSGLGSRMSLLNQEWCGTVGAQVAAYHFCQIDNSETCFVPEFLRNLIAQLAATPSLKPYAEWLAKLDNLPGLLSDAEILKDAVGIFRTYVVDPLSTIRRQAGQNLLILIDGLCEAEFHRPEFGESIGSFVVKYFRELPAYLRLVFTVKTAYLDLVRGFPCHKISLENLVMDERLFHDCREYVTTRIQMSPNLQAQISAVPGANAIAEFVGHCVSLCKGNILYLRLTLNLIEQGNLVLKSANFKIVPVNLSEVFLLLFNLRFPSAAAFEAAAPILNLVLASLYPLTGRQIYESYCAGIADGPPSWEAFCPKFLLVAEFLVQRQDDTYVLFHPAFRQWLIRREDGESPKFLCDLRSGHALLALRLSRNPKLLDADSLQELCHHLLKAHVYKNLAKEMRSVSARDTQAFWVSFCARDVENSLVTTKNIFCFNSKISRLLLLAGANPDAKTPFFENSPLLCVAARMGIMDFVLLLLEFGADVGAVGEDGISALMHAAAAGNIDVVHVLFQHGAKLHQVDTSNRCALVHAAQAGHVNICSFLLLQCDWSDTNSDNSGDETSGIESYVTYGNALKQQAAQQAFVAAAEAGHSQICQFLLDFGDVKLDDPCPILNETALSMACLRGRKETVQYLLNCGAKTSYGRCAASAPAAAKRTPPLIQAVASGSWEIVTMLLNSGVLVRNEFDAAGRSAVHIAAMQGHIGVLELLLSRDQSIISLVDSAGMTPLCWAAAGDSIPCANLLLDRGANANFANAEGQTPLHFAAQSGSKAIANLLLERGGRLESANSDGNRPLEFAIFHKNFDVVATCLKRGAKLGPQAWLLAQDKPEVLLMLLNKLCEDGNLLYKRNRIKDANHRYHYALRKFPADLDLDRSVFDDLKTKLLINHARCQRKLGDAKSAVELCSKALQLRSQSFEAFYIRSRCYRDLRHFELAMADCQTAIRISPADRDARHLLARLKSETGDAKENRNLLNSSISLSEPAADPDWLTKRPILKIDENLIEIKGEKSPKDGSSADSGHPADVSVTPPLEIDRFKDSEL